MGHKIFVSYKYADDNVQRLASKEWFEKTTVRDYVDLLEDELYSKSDHIYKGEHDGEDLSQLSDETIWEKLKNRIYDSTITVVMISPGMKDMYKSERNQWIPQEISYSLKEISRIDCNGNPVTSKINAVLCVILPDLNGSYDYFVEKKYCCSSGCNLYVKPSNVFEIINNNLFNIKNPESYTCTFNSRIYMGDPSYFLCVRWKDFINYMDTYIEAAYKLRDKSDDYIIQKEI